MVVCYDMTELQCCQVLMAYGYEDEVAMEASQLYSDVSDAIEYIQHNLKDTLL